MGAPSARTIRGAPPPGTVSIQPVSSTALSSLALGSARMSPSIDVPAPSLPHQHQRRRQRVGCTACREEGGGGAHAALGGGAIDGRGLQALNQDFCDDVGEKQGVIKESAMEQLAGAGEGGKAGAGIKGEKRGRKVGEGEKGGSRAQYRGQGRLQERRC